MHKNAAISFQLVDHRDGGVIHNLDPSIHGYITPSFTISFGREKKRKGKKKFA